MQRPWGIKEPELFEKETRGQDAGRSRVWDAVCTHGEEHGFYSKCNRKLFKSFKQESDTI